MGGVVSRRSSNVEDYEVTDEATTGKLAAVADLENTEEQQGLGDFEQIILNVGGQVHRTKILTLMCKPNTRLYYLAEYHRSTRADTQRANDSKDIKEYFFDRNPDVFSSVLNYYRIGELHVPASVCSSVIRKELEYWQIDDSKVEPCCFVNYYSNTTVKRLNAVRLEDREERVRLRGMTGIRKYRLHLWRLLTRPNSSRPAKMYATVALLVVLLSVISYCLESLKEFRISVDIPKYCLSSNEHDISKPINAFLAIECCSSVFFTIELIFCLATAPNVKQFFTNTVIIIDLLTVLPFYAMLIDEAVNECPAVNAEYFNVIRALRILRVHHIGMMFEPLRILFLALKDSVYELAIMLIYLFILIILFASAIYLSERHLYGATDFKIILIGFWWAIVTLTTVGYGDIYPRSAWGYVVGGFCAVTGSVILALIIPIISANFMNYYTCAMIYKVAREDREKKKLWREHLVSALRRLSLRHHIRHRRNKEDDDDQYKQNSLKNLTDSQQNQQASQSPPNP